MSLQPADSYWHVRAGQPPIVVGVSRSSLIRQALSQQLAAAASRTVVVGSGAEAAGIPDAAVYVATSLELRELARVRRGRPLLVILLTGHKLDPSMASELRSLSLLSDRYLLTDLTVALGQLQRGARTLILDPDTLAQIVRPLAPLTTREWLVLCHLLYEVEEGQIASSIQVARETVTRYIKRARQKLGGISRAELHCRCLAHMAAVLGRLPDNLPGVVENPSQFTSRAMARLNTPKEIG